MKIGIISDTHDHMENIRFFVGKFKEKGVGHVLHAGDIISPFAAKPFSPFKFTAVFGNNCGERLFLRDIISQFGEIKPGPLELEIGGKKILLMHEPYALEAAAHSELYHYVIYGHTHYLERKKIKNTWIINPGEGCGYLTGKATALVLDLETDEVELLKK